VEAFITVHKTFSFYLVVKKKLENRFTFAKVIMKHQVFCFLTHGVDEQGEINLVITPN